MLSFNYITSFNNRFKGSYLFHSVPYLSSSKDTLETEEYNKLGSPASLGCVRLCVADAIWIYENCPVNTTVILYDDESSPGPLGKPESIKIPLDSPYAGWDPTDPDEANPWHAFSASIKAKTDNLNVTVGTKVEGLLSNFTAKDTCGNDISDKITIEGNYNLNIVGKYTVTVNVVDAIGSKASMTVSLIVSSVPETTTSDKTTTEQPSESTTTEPETTTEPNTTTGDNSSEQTPSDDYATSSESISEE